MSTVIYCTSKLKIFFFGNRRNWRPQHLGNLIYITYCYNVESVCPRAAKCFHWQEWLYSFYGSEIFYIEFFMSHTFASGLQANLRQMGALLFIHKDFSNLTFDIDYTTSQTYLLHSHKDDNF